MAVKSFTTLAIERHSRRKIVCSQRHQVIAGQPLLQQEEQRLLLQLSPATKVPQLDPRLAQGQPRQADAEVDWDKANPGQA